MLRAGLACGRTRREPNLIEHSHADNDLVVSAQFQYHDLKYAIICYFVKTSKCFL